MPWKSQEGIVFLLKPVSVGEANTVCICIVLQKTYLSGMGKMVSVYNVNVNWLCRCFRAGSKRILAYIQSCHIIVAPKGPSKKWLLLHCSVT